MVSAIAKRTKTEPAPDRDRLGFAAAVSDAFEFLLENGFELVELSDTFARYESARRIIQVFHGRGSYELSVELGRWIVVDGVRREQAFPLRDVVALTSDPAAIGYGGTSATTADTVRKFVDRLAAWTQQFASSLLSDGDDVFEELSRRTAARGLADRDAQRARLLRSRADAAWRDRDFATVANSYAEIDKELSTVDLSPSEQGRLHYALRALND
jgi:hypothetical protein